MSEQWLSELPITWVEPLYRQPWELLNSPLPPSRKEVTKVNSTSLHKQREQKLASVVETQNWKCEPMFLNSSGFLVQVWSSNFTPFLNLVFNLINTIN